MNPQYSDLKTDYEQLAEENSLYQDQVNEKEAKILEMKVRSAMNLIKFMCTVFQ